MMASSRHSEMGAAAVLAGGHLAAFLFGWSVSGEGEIPACAGMTVAGAGMAAGEGEIPACAGMTGEGAGMTTEVKPPDWNAAQAFGKAAAGGHDGV